MHKITYSLFLALSFSYNALDAGQSIASKLYCSVLGNQDASPTYKDLTYQALTNLGVKNPDNVSVKQMNGVGPAFARINLSSFTTFGLWLDEAYLDTCTQEEKLFHIYHEAAHYASNHHQKILAGIAVALPLSIFGLVKLNKYLPEKKITKVAIYTGIACATLTGIYFGVLPSIVKHQEKQADIRAAKTLISLGKEDVVLNRIQTLKTYKDANSTDIWWYSNAEQIKYLENLAQPSTK